MKQLLAIATVATVFLGTGCIYNEPLVEIDSHPINPSFLGLWEEVPKNDKTTDRDRLLVFKYSDTEYLVLYDEELYFRGYPVRPDGVKCIQLEIIGSNKGDIAKKSMKRFLPVRCEIKDDQLEIRILDPQLVDEDLETSKALMSAFLKHKDNPRLFNEPGRFKRIKKEK